MRPIKRNEKITYSLDSKNDQAEFFLSYGFLDPNSPYRAALNLAINNETPHKDIKLALILKSAPSKEFNLSKDVDEKAWRVMISWARFLVYDADPIVLTDANNEACSEDTTLYHGFDLPHPGFHGLNLHPTSIE